METVKELQDIKVNLEINAKKAIDNLQLMQDVRGELKSQFTLGKIGESGFLHLLPRAKTGMTGDEFSEIVSLFLHCFDTACIHHCLKGLEVSILPNEIISQ